MFSVGPGRSHAHLFSPAATASGTGDQEAAGARAEEEVRGDGAAPQGGGAQARREGTGRKPLHCAGNVQVGGASLHHLSSSVLSPPSLLVAETLLTKFPVNAK